MREHKRFRNRYENINSNALWLRPILERENLNIHEETDDIDKQTPTTTHVLRVLSTRGRPLSDV